MKKIVSLLVFTIVLLTAHSQNGYELSATIPVDPNVRIGKLSNGMTYYIRKNTKPERRAEFKLAVNAGAMQEDNDQLGLAHFTEHMAFNGTKTFPHNEIITYLEASGIKFGAQLNAYTSQDQTVYRLEVPTDSVKLFNMAFQIMDDWAHNLLLDNKEVDQERGVIIEEWRLGQSAGERMRKQYSPILFKDSKYADRNVIGTEESLKNFTYDAIKRFYTDWYRPDLMAIIVVGDFDVDKIEAMVKERFSKIPAANNPRKHELFTVKNNKDILIARATDKEANSTDLDLVYKLPTETTTTIADYKRNIIHGLFTSMLNNRIDEIIQKPNAPFLSASVRYGELTRTINNYDCEISVKDGELEKGLAAIVAENERVKRYGFTQSELERRKIEIIASLESSFKEKNKTDHNSYANSYVGNFLRQSPIPGIENNLSIYKQLLPTITLDDVNKTASKFITNGENLVVVITAPEKDKDKIPTDKRITSIIENASKLKLDPYKDDVASKPLIEKKPAGVKIVDEKKIEQFGITEIKLANGVKVIYKKTDYKNDEILMEARSWGGYSVYPENTDMSAKYASTIMNMSGISDFNDIQLSKLLTGKIVRVSPFISDKEEGFSGRVAPKDLETMFQLIYLYFYSPRVDSNAFKSFIEKQKALLQNRNANPATAFNDTIQLVMNQHHYRARITTADLLNEINPNLAFRLFRDRFSNAADFTFYFVGNFEPTELRQYAETYLGSLPQIRRNETWKDMGIRYPKGKLEKVVKKGVDKKSQVLLKIQGPFEWSRTNRYEIYILSKIAGIKLREAVREEKSGTYGIGISINAVRYPSSDYYVNIGFSCNPDRAEELVKTVIEVIEKLKTQGIEEADINKVREILKRERETYLKDNNFWMNVMVADNTNNENILELNDYYNYLDKITTADVKQFAVKYFNFANYAKFVMLPE